jgi:hypothetical protein
VSDNFDLVCFSANDSIQIAKIYNEYITLSKLQLQNNNKIALLNENISLYKSEILEYKNTISMLNISIDVLQKDRDTGYDLYLQEASNSDKQHRKYILKTIFISAGAGIVGIGLGILIGIFVI